MLTDRYGNTLTTGSAAARDAYDEGLDLFLGANAGVTEAFERAIAADPGFALAHLARARSLHMRGRGREARAGLADARKAAEAGVSALEAAQLALMGDVIEGRGGAALPAIRAHLAGNPRDAFVAQTCMGVFSLIGFSGVPGREAEQLAFTTSLAPHYGDDWWFLSQHAFAQMECGQTGPARQTITRAFELNPVSGNSAHVKAHLHYETGETREGLAFLDDWRRGYDRASLLHCHVSWHVALWSLEEGDVETMWSVIDADIFPGAAVEPAINILTDSAAILYRAQLAGVEVPEGRWQAVSDYAAQCFPKPAIAFADAHAALAHAMAGQGERLEKVVRDAAGPAGDVVKVLAEGFGALAAGRWEEAVGHLTPALREHARIGGSRAQRDLIEHAMLGALLRVGREGEARRLIAMRRPSSSMHGAVAGLQ